MEAVPEVEVDVDKVGKVDEVVKWRKLPGR
jgi:hypothetical protein